MPSSDIINCKNISKSFVTIPALKDISFSVNEGESIALVGANGAGKSTLFNIILGLLKPDEGSCSILDTTSELLTPDDRGKIGFIADHAGPIPWASTHDLATLYSKLYFNWDKKKYEHIIKTWNIDIYRRLNNLSKGQKRLAELALITAIQPKIMVLDEPFDGLDAVVRINVQKFLVNLQQKERITILYATHIISELSSVANRMIVLKSGNLVYDQPITNDTESPDAIFRKLYVMEIEN